jgi:hypothetical protein
MRVPKSTTRTEIEELSRSEGDLTREAAEGAWGGLVEALPSRAATVIAPRDTQTGQSSGKLLEMVE